MVGVILLARRLWDARGAWNAGLIAAGAYVAGVAVLFALLPSVNEMPEGFAPLVIWNFRVVSLGIHLILWTVIGLGFGVAAERLLEGGPRPQLARA
jgi:hypothetical protein